LQDLVAQTDGFAQNIGFSGTKLILNHLFGYGKFPRRPLTAIPEHKRKEILQNEWFVKIMAHEAQLQAAP
jgi:4-hydroxy-2-oxoglutarate aldolase